MRYHFIYMSRDFKKKFTINIAAYQKQHIHKPRIYLVTTKEF